MLGASLFYLLTVGNRALNGPWRHGTRRRLGFRSLAGPLPTRAPADSDGHSEHLKGRRVRGVQDQCSTEFRKESGGFRGAHTSQSKFRYFGKRTSPSTQPFGERWLYSEISPKATLHQKRPGGTQNAPQSSRRKVSGAASTFQSRSLRGGKC